MYRQGYRGVVWPCRWFMEWQEDRKSTVLTPGMFFSSLTILKFYITVSLFLTHLFPFSKLTDNFCFQILGTVTIIGSVKTFDVLVPKQFGFYGGHSSTISSTFTIFLDVEKAFICAGILDFYKNRAKFCSYTIMFIWSLPLLGTAVSMWKWTVLFLWKEQLPLKYHRAVSYVPCFSLCMSTTCPCCLKSGWSCLITSVYVVNFSVEMAVIWISWMYTLSGRANGGSHQMQKAHSHALIGGTWLLWSPSAVSKASPWQTSHLATYFSPPPHTHRLWKIRLFFIKRFFSHSTSCFNFHFTLQSSQGMLLKYLYFYL